MPTQANTEAGNVVAGIEVLSQSVDSLNEAVKALANRLAPVLLPAVPEAESSGKGEMLVMSDVAVGIESVRARVRAIDISIEKLISRIDV